MSDCNGNCGSCGDSSCADRTQESLLAPMNPNSNVKKVIGIVSGKGGVGKSLVTSLMAVLMQRCGRSTAVLDADITGPSIPKAFGIKGRATGSETEIYPRESTMGTKVMSVNLLLEDETAPVVWRGPVIAGVIKQFWSEVLWGDVDFMFVDMPPGTGDVPLTVFQSLPVDGIIVVTSPQELVSMIVEKAVNMADMMNIPVLGIVENMAYAECPHCGERIEIFGESKTAEIAKKHGIDMIAQIPMNKKLAAACDKGMIELFDGEWLDEILQKLLNM